jgi:hypothetical protein
MILFLPIDRFWVCGGSHPSDFSKKSGPAGDF